MNDDSKLFETFAVALLASWVFGLSFVICEFGEHVTNQFDMFGQVLEQGDWYTLSIEMQRMYYLIFLSDTQQLKEVSCYGNILCARITFKKVFNHILTVQQNTLIIHSILM